MDAKVINPELNRLLKRGVAEIISEPEMIELLHSGRKLRLKEGFDPSAPDIHLGHMVSLRKLRQFQAAGHQVVLIVADWTARIGDPSGVKDTRPFLSREQVLENAETYMQQFFKIVDKDRTEIRWQSEWFGKFTLTEVINLTSKFTIAQILAREDFAARLDSGRPITLTELLYPLLQAYDSVAIRADVEFGGTDQKFNLLVGRELQTMEGQPPQQCFMVPLLIGTDGIQKMSKTLPNRIGIAEHPNDIYGKVMSINDNLIMPYFELLTDVSEGELEEFRQALLSQTVNPMTLKKRLAQEIIIQLFNEESARTAGDYFSRTVQKKALPEEIREFHISFGKLSPKDTEEPVLDVSRLLVETGLVKSRSEAMRLIKQGGIEINGEKITRAFCPVAGCFLVQAGKWHFAKVINTDTI